MTSNERADFRFANCPYRDIIGCNNFMCLDCPSESETYSMYLHYKQLKQLNNEKDYPFCENPCPCPF